LERGFHRRRADRRAAAAFADLSAKLQEQLVAWDGILSHDLTGLNRTAAEKKLALVEIPAK
jgi:hypothetical protein